MVESWACRQYLHKVMVSNIQGLTLSFETFGSSTSNKVRWVPWWQLSFHLDQVIFYKLIRNFPTNQVGKGGSISRFMKNLVRHLWEKFKITGRMLLFFTLETTKVKIRKWKSESRKREFPHLVNYCAIPKFAAYADGQFLGDFMVEAVV